MNMDDQIMAQIVQKEDAGLKLLMDRYGDMILRMVYMMTKDRMLAEDISQETFLTIYQKAEQYEGAGKLKNWLLKIALNLCRAYMRKAAWKRLLFRDIKAEEVVSREIGPEQSAVQQELIAQLQHLPYTYREVIILFYYHDLSIKEISHLTNQKEGSVRTKLSRGRAKLREILAREGWQDA